MSEALRQLPSVDQVLGLPAIEKLLRRYRRDYVVELVRRALENLRDELRQGGGGERTALLQRAGEQVLAAADARQENSLRRVVNATGVILHTGLGRAPLSRAAQEALQRAAEHYCNLEFDLESGRRGERLSHVEGLVCEAALCEAAAVVNNNAAAVLLVLHALARGREVVVSRGQLVEIGGSFRIPDIVEASGATIREVGTTNRTHLRDYEAAIGPQTALVLAVHPSNYKVRGFTAEVGLEELAGLSRGAGVPLFYDLGGGALEDLAQWGLPHEPVVRQSLAAGADLVSFSGDKVLGGPQSGIVAGRRRYLQTIVRNPLMRALRCDKLVLAALEASLRLYRLGPEALRRAQPVLAMMAASVEELEARAERLLEAVPAAARQALAARIEPSVAQAGSGALPLEELPSRALVLGPQALAAEELARRLRGEGVVGRIERERLLLDMRTVADGEVEWVARALTRAVAP